MRNFCFHNPTKIIFGRGAIADIGPETAQLGRKALLVYGQKSIKRTGIHRVVVQSLAQAGIAIVEHGGVRPNPVVSHVRTGIGLARMHEVDVIVAVGGGSVLDSGKAISAGAVVDHDVWQFFKGRKGIRRTLPLACVLTLAAAGSEMNSGMVLTNGETGQKIGIGNKLLHPSVSILDPAATCTVPASHTAYGAVDALSHILEFYHTAEDRHTPVQDRLMEGLALNIMESCARVLREPDNYNARADLMWCTTLALNGLTAAGLGRVGFPMHMIEHSLSALYDIPHGAGLSVVMPAWMTDAARRAPRKFAQFAERVLQVPTGPAEASAAKGIARLKGWFQEIGCPVSLAAVDIPASDIPAIAENALEQARIWRLREYSRERIEAILHACR